ncbi:MAG: hypothetical protein AAF401_15520 [Pseudomonadota bacterium]
MTRLIAPALLLLAAAGFGWLAAMPWLDQRASAPAALGAAPEAENHPTPPEAAAGPKPLDAFTARPLFSAARRPPPPKEAGQPVEAPNADLLFGAYEVAGVVKLGDRMMAMLRDTRDGRLLRLRPGDSLDDAEVREITLDSLTFDQGGVTVIAPVGGRSAGE